ncbi:MAG: esterase [Chloroflexi bacterium HGW-Chloroflexi-6]|nr:MAG: esterase [Chloroflexi bacterium HGW-Chloroflexi-6]
MILTEVKFFSEILGMRSTMNVLLPQQALADKTKPSYRTLYLLHGHSDDHTAWQRWTSIERYVEGLNIAVVMPNVHLSFYTDMAHGGRYWTFVSEEVPALARSLFPLSAARADNFVAGLSMGGYGAFKLALAHPERFAAAASLSGAVDIRHVVNEDGPDRDEAWLAGMRNIFGADLKQVADSQNDLRTLARSAAKAAEKPRLYQCCGTEDFLYQNNLSFRDFLRGLPLDLTYEEGPGEHTWAFWDKMIQNVLTWMVK